MTWEILNLIGTSAFAVSGAVVAREAKYDVFGIFILGLVTAFGGGIIRNILFGISLDALWSNNKLIITALGVILLVLLLPKLWDRYLKAWTFFDAIGLAAFSVQGAFIVESQGFPLTAVIVAAVMTGCGGGMIRDILAGIKPLVFRSEVYAVWSILAGLVIGLGWGAQPWELYLLSLTLVICRIISIRFKWKLPPSN